MTKRRRSKRYGKRRWLLPTAIVFVVAALAVVGALFLFGSSPSDAAERDDLEAEFWGAYLRSAAGGGPTIEVDLTAAPATVELLDGVETAVWCAAKCRRRTCRHRYR